MDINRGRDFGVPPYSTMRLLCGLSPVNSFEDLKDVMEDEVSISSSLTYSHVNPLSTVPTNQFNIHSPSASYLIPTASNIDKSSRRPAQLVAYPDIFFKLVMLKQLAYFLLFVSELLDNSNLSSTLRH